MEKIVLTKEEYDDAVVKSIADIMLKEDEGVLASALAGLTFASILRNALFSVKNKEEK